MTYLTFKWFFTGMYSFMFFNTTFFSTSIWTIVIAARIRFFTGMCSYMFNQSTFDGGAIRATTPSTGILTFAHVFGTCVSGQVGFERGTIIT